MLAERPMANKGRFELELPLLDTTRLVVPDPAISHSFRTICSRGTVAPTCGRSGEPKFVSLVSVRTSAGMPPGVVITSDEVTGRTFYRFYGLRGPIPMQVYFDVAHHNNKFILQRDARYIIEQSRIRRAYYRSLTQIRDAVIAAVGSGGEEVFSTAFLLCNSTSKVVKVGKRETEIWVFDYPVFPSGCTPRTVRMTVRKDGSGFILTKRDADLIISDETRRRREYIGVAKVASRCGVSQATIKKWALAADEEYLVYRGTAYVKREYGEGISKERKAVELPQGAKPIHAVLRQMRITRSTFTRGVIEEGGRWFFQYKTRVSHNFLG
jgi:hypothetical protein